MKRFLIAAAAGVVMLGANAARADVDVRISVGIPGVIYERPHYHRRPPPRVVVVPSYPERPVVVYSNRHDYYYDKPHKRHKHWKNNRWKDDHRKDRDRDRHWHR
jgi:hypothetical protein